MRQKGATNCEHSGKADRILRKRGVSVRWKTKRRGKKSRFSFFSCFSFSPKPTKEIPDKNQHHNDSRTVQNKLKLVESDSRIVKNDKRFVQNDLKFIPNDTRIVQICK